MAGVHERTQRNTYIGGPGNDFIDAANGYLGERIDCGTGFDRVLTDRSERANRGMRARLRRPLMPPKESR